MTGADFASDGSMLRKQLAERDATIADRDKTIAKLTKDVALLQEAVKTLLAQRRGGYRVHDRQGLLFPSTFTPAESTEPTTAVDPEPDDGGQAQPAPTKKKARRASRAKSTPLACRARTACTTWPSPSASIG